MITQVTPLFWVLFLTFVAGMLALDLGVFHRSTHEVSNKESLMWVCVWALLACVFGAGVYHFMGQQKSLEFFSGYVIEQCLSVDNLFVIVLVFKSFDVPLKYQHRVLFWGILGAVLMRGLVIVTGIEIVSRLHAIMYFFGAFLIYTAIKLMFSSDDDEPNPQDNAVLKLFSKYVPSTSKYYGDQFIAIEAGKKVATPLLASLVVVEAMDMVFAVDSIPAIFAVTLDPFIVFTSNIFAIMGLRSLYFLLANAVDQFVYLKYGLALILGFVGTKMLIEKWVHIPVGYSLGFIVCVLVLSMVTSRFAATSDKPKND